MPSPASLKIRIYPDPCLRQKSAPVEQIGIPEKMLIDAMLETMHANKGIGLAAPQIGINQQIIVVDIGEGPLALVNPKIKRRRGGDLMEEGCLSLPGIVVTVRRPVEIWVEYLDARNKPQLKNFKDLLARVIQHETDHINGKLIVDYAGWGEKIRVRRQLKELQVHGRVLEPEQPKRNAAV